MTYAGLGAILFRFAGLLLLGFLIFSLLPALATGAQVRSQLLLTGGIYLLPAAILVIASKPLGRVLAAGLD